MLELALEGGFLFGGDTSLRPSRCLSVAARLFKQIPAFALVAAPRFGVGAGSPRLRARASRLRSHHRNMKHWAMQIRREVPRLLLLPLAIGVILVSTATPSGFRPPSLHDVILLGAPGDVVLNLVLYAPLGVALARRGVLAATLFGAGLSAVIEVSQFLMPNRFPGVTDVLMNSAGTLAGAVSASLCGRQLGWYPDSLPLYRPVAGAVLIAGVLLVTPRPLRQDFSNWDPQHQVRIGDEITGGRPWNGTLERAVILGEVLTEPQIQSLPENGAVFRAAEFEWQADGPTPRLLAPDESRRALADVQRKNRMTVLVWMRPADVRQTGPARILTYSRDLQHRNFTLGQEERSLVFRIRTPVSGPNGRDFAVTTRPVLDANRRTLVAATYDGRNSRIYVDGFLAACQELPASRARIGLPGDAGTAQPFVAGILMSAGLLGLVRPRGRVLMSLVVFAGGLAGGVLFWRADRATLPPLLPACLGASGGLTVLASCYFGNAVLSARRERFSDFPSES